MSGGKSWLLRTCSDRRAWTQRKGRTIQLIAIHLRHSRSLKAEAKLVFYSPQEIKIDIDRIAKIIALKKKIPLESEAFGVLKESLTHILQLEKLISHVIKRARSQFNLQEHLHLLQSLWMNLEVSNEPVPGIPDKRWQDLGFQGTDPSTDFRGMGLLGLDNLLAFTQIAPKSAHNLWQQSKLGSAWFTFATVGINITALLYSFLVSRSADEYLYSQSSTDGIDTFNHAYQLVFEKFGQYWIVEEAKDVMDFSRIFGKLKTDLEFNLESRGELQ
jgi:hypothetical protein